MVTFGRLFAGLWFTERRHSEEIKRIYAGQTVTPSLETLPQQSPRKDRTLQELSPTYNESIKQDKTFYDYAPEEVFKFLRNVVDEWLQPDLTPVERHTVKEKLVDLFHHGRGYDRNRELYHTERADNLLNSLDENGEDDSE